MRTPRLLLSAWLLAACGNDEPVQEPAPLRDLSDAFEYPVELWDQGVDGQTILMLHITPHGDVDTSYVAISSGYPEFDSAALRGVRDARFTPARRGDQRIPMWVRLPVRFSHGAASGSPASLDAQ